MKKKLLSLFLAGAMVASTSVSAFADEFDIQQGADGTDVNVSITGNVEAQDGTTVPGTVTVTVPTAAVFNVNHSDGSIKSAAMEIVNNSEEQVLVYASSFTDATGENKIKLVKENELEGSSSRKDVFLKLTGGSRDIYFTSEEKDHSGKYGKIYDITTGNELAAGTEIANVNKQSKVSLRLEGKGSTSGGNLDSPIADNFKLVLKIKRVK